MVDWRRDIAYFLTYRFGSAEGGAVRAARRELRDLARWAKESRLRLNVTRVRRTRREGEVGWIRERGVGQAHAWRR